MPLLSINPHTGELVCSATFGATYMATGWYNTYMYICKYKSFLKKQLHSKHLTLLPANPTPHVHASTIGDSNPAGRSVNDYFLLEIRFDELHRWAARLQYSLLLSSMKY